VTKILWNWFARLGAKRYHFTSGSPCENGCRACFSGKVHNEHYWMVRSVAQCVGRRPI